MVGSIRTWLVEREAIVEAGGAESRCNVISEIILVSNNLILREIMNGLMSWFPILSECETVGAPCTGN
jgi:hypothetical protein